MKEGVDEGTDAETGTESETLRPGGLAAGEFVVSDDFNDALPDELLDAFEGRSDYSPTEHETSSLEFKDGQSDDRESG